LSGEALGFNKNPSRKEAIYIMIIYADQKKSNTQGAGSAAGLSTAHRAMDGVILHGLEIWEGGSLIQVKMDVGRSLPARGGGRRGTIRGFSRQSRLRLMRKLGTIRKDEVPVFVTLTYPDRFPEDAETQKRNFDAMRARLLRKGAGAVWRREWKPRQSGENAGKLAPHWHLLVWGMGFKELRDWLPSAWYEVCGRICPEHLQAGVSVERLRCWNAVMAYTSKYIAKVVEEGEFTHGRAWGVINPDRIPWAKKKVAVISLWKAFDMMRYMRRYAGIRARSNWTSLAIMVHDPVQWGRLIC
jgi:hypothetical protein